jgi:hypothetical protein
MRERTRVTGVDLDSLREALEGLLEQALRLEANPLPDKGIHIGAILVKHGAVQVESVGELVA